MTRRGACAPRCWVGRPLGFERLEDRLLLSPLSSPSIPQWVGFATEFPTVPSFVSRASTAAFGDSRAPEGIFNILSPPQSDPPGPPPGIGMFVRSSGSSGTVESMSGVTNRGIAGAVAPTVSSMTISFPVVVINGDTSTSDPLSSTLRTAADATVSSAGSGLSVASSPVAAQVSTPGPLIPSAPSLALAGSVSQAVGTAGFSSPGSELSAGGATVDAPVFLSSQMSFATFVGTTSNGQTNITFSLLASGDLFLAEVPILARGQIKLPLLIDYSPGVSPSFEAPASTAVATSGSLLLAPLATEPPDGYARIATNSADSLGVAANSTTAAPAVGIKKEFLAPAVTFKVSCSDGPPPAPAHTLTFDSSKHAKISPSCGVPDAETKCIDATTDLGPAPQRSDLMTDFMPFDQAAVGQTIDQFLQQLKGLGAGLSWLQRPRDLVVELLSVAVALTAWSLVPRFLRPSPDDELSAVDEATSLDGISGLPGGSSLEEP
jgi:hypothetical protein